VEAFFMPLVMLSSISTHHRSKNWNFGLFDISPMIPSAHFNQIAVGGFKMIT
jgi:hypothetical protein